MPFGSTRLSRVFDLRRLSRRELIAGSIVLGGGLAALLWLPRIVRDQVESRLRARTGLSAQVKQLSLGFTSLSIGELVLGDAAGPSVHARAIVLDAWPLALALRGTRALDGVAIGELQVRVPTQTAATRALIERLLARRGAEPSSDAAPRRRPDLRIDRLSAVLRDERGVLFDVSGGRVNLAGDDARLEIARVRIGDEPASELEHVVLEAKRSAQGFRLRRASVADARLQIAERVEQPKDAAPPEADEDTDAPVDAPAPNAPPTPTAAVARVTARNAWQRILAVVKMARPTGDAKLAAPAAAAASGMQAQGQSPFDRLTDDAELTLGAATVSAASSKTPILTGLKATLKAQPGRAFSLVASGKAAGGGLISCDLAVRPEQVRADGQVILRSLPLSLIAPFLPNVPWYEPEHGKVDAELVIKTEPAKGIAFSGDASLSDAGISSERIAATPVRDIDLTLSGHGRFLPLQHRLEVTEAELALRGTAMQVKGAVEWSRDHYLFDLDATLPPTACTKVVRSIPEDLLGDMALASWQGKFGGHVRLKLDSRALDDGELVLTTSDHCEFVTVPAMADLRRFRMPFIHSVVEPDGTLFEMETGPGSSAWTFLEDISPFLVHAVLAHEDAGFFSHHGFSPRHIRDALVRNLKEGRYVVGASTITMQLVKNVFLHREKTLARKIQEVLLTWWIERVMEKRDIIELYLNVIEYGPAVYGIRNAAKHYFNRLPSQLSPAEAIYLSTILPNPKRYHLAFERGSVGAGRIDEMRKMLARMRAREWYSPEAVDYGMKELESFHFVPEGTITPPRQIPGGTAPLPYMQDFAQHGGEDGDADPPTAAAADAARLGAGAGIKQSTERSHTNLVR